MLTSTGQSGSPVLKRGPDGTLTPIAVHTYGGRTQNSGTPIGPVTEKANPLQEYANLFSAGAVIQTSTAAVPKLPDGVSVVSVTLQESAFTGAPTNGGSSTAAPAETPAPVMSQESFWGFLKNVAKTGIPIAQNVLSNIPISSLGSVGTILAPIAGVALNTAGKLVNSGGTESDLVDDQKGTVSRTVLAEAALQAVLTLDRQELQESGIFDDMRKFVSKHIATVNKVAPALSHAIVEPALRVSLDTVREAHQTLEEGPPTTIGPKRRVLPGAETLTESGMPYDAFVRGLVSQPTKVVPGAEDIFGDIFGGIKTAVSVASNFVPGPAGLGLKVISGVLGGGESELVGGSETSASGIFEPLAHRALAGEAALQALMKRDNKYLSTPRTVDEEGDQESLFDTIKTGFQRCWPKVLKALPTVLKVVTPVVSALVKDKGESAFEDVKSMMSLVPGLPPSHMMGLGPVIPPKSSGIPPPIGYSSFPTRVVTRKNSGFLGEVENPALNTKKQGNYILRRKGLMTFQVWNDR